MEYACMYTPFSEINCRFQRESGGTSGTIAFGADLEGWVVAPAAAVASEETWQQAHWMWFDAVNSGPHSMALTLSFWDADNASDTPDLVSTIGLLPGLRTRVSFPLVALDSQHMFLQRTPAKLKTVIHGNKVRQLHRLAIGRKCCTYGQELTIGPLHLSSNEPEYVLPQTPLIDDLGQWAKSEWPDKTSDAAALHAQLVQKHHDVDAAHFFPEWTENGSLREKKFDATGFFRTHQESGQWWLVDPQGFAFYSLGVDCVRPGDAMRVTGNEPLCGPLPAKEGPFADAWAERYGSWEGDLYDSATANLIRVFGAGWMDAWKDIARANLRSWGFNTVGNWSHPDFTGWSGLPYVHPMTDFPTTTQRIFRDFPDVFSPEYKAAAERFAAQMAPLSNDRNLIGYFLRNEPEWAFIKNLDIAEELLESTAMLDSREAFVRYLADQYLGEIDKLNESWGSSFSSFDDFRSPIRKARNFPGSAADLTAFSRMLIDRYVRIPSLAVRAVDPNHLNLGMRYGFISSDDLLAGSDCFDVFSINCYDIDPRQAIEKAGTATGLPVMIGEFHFGALDRGLSATGIRGADGQTERGRAYRRYVELAASSKWCVGTHYFQYNDQPALGRFDGENYNIGLIDVCQTPHLDFLQEIIPSHRDIYAVAAGLIPPTNVQGRLIHPIFY